MAFGQYSGGIGAVAGGIIGGIIGYYTPLGAYQGAMLGASIGGAAGGIAGSVFWPEKIDINHPLPPKPHENRVQISTYGSSIPIVYESSRVAGNIIYMSDVNKTVTRTKHRQDGVRYYELVVTYTATFAISFSEGPVVGLSRIWVNGQIFADYRDPASPYYPTGDIALASANLSTSIAREASFYSVYLGTGTQVADTALTALLTAAETPTYRGIFYIVFRDFPVGEFSGVPTIEVEIDVPVATDVCSEYFNGTDGMLPSETLFTRDWSYGPDPTIQSNKLVFTSSSQKEFYGTYEFLGEFDYSLDFELTATTGDSAGWVYIGANLTNSVFYDWYSNVDMDYYADTGDYVTSDTSGKLRLVRDASNNIYAYVWNTGLARWEWNGNTAGLLIVNIVGAVVPYFGVQCYADSTVSIGDFIVTSGCDNTQPRSS